MTRRRAALFGSAALLPLAAVAVAFVRAGDGPVVSPARPAKAAAAAATASRPAEEHWQVVTVGDDRVGYARTRTVPLPAEGGRPERFRTDSETKMVFKRFGQEIKLGVRVETTETADGDLLDFRYEMTNPPAAPMTSVGTVRDGRLSIESTVAGRAATKTIPWEPSTKSPAWQERLLREQGLRPGESKSFRAFVPEFNQVSDVRVAAGDVREVKLPDGTTRKLLKAKVTQSVLPTMPTTAWLDDRGNVVLAESDFSGQTMRLFEVSREDAVKEVAGVELDLGMRTLIPVTSLEDPHGTKKVVYRVRTPGVDAAALFATGDTQQVRRIDAETAEVTVVAKPAGQGRGRVKAPPEVTGPTQLVQSRDVKVLEHVNRAVSPDRPPGEAAVALEKYVHEKVADKTMSTAFASAAETAERLEGDCTEHAVLLAAMLRARGVPSRVAVGLVYVPGQAKMGGHMWTEALFAEGWTPLDATLGRGGIGGGHLKVADSDLSDDAPLPVTAFAPLMSLGPETTIEVIKVER